MNPNHDHELAITPDALEPVASHLRQAFAGKAATSSLDTVMRRARGRARARRRLALAGAAVAVAVAVSGGVTLWPARPAPSYATVNPDPVTPELRTAVARLCPASAHQGPPPSPALRRAWATWRLPPLAILDRHGEVAYALFSHANDGARDTTSCFLTRNAGTPRAANLAGWSVLWTSIDYGPTSLAPLTAPLAVDRLESVSVPGYGAAVAGRVTEAVRTVVVVRKDSVRIAATIHNGTFAAFWSKPSPPETVVALGERGKVLHTRRLCMPTGDLRTVQRETLSCLKDQHR